jgi:VanZ family protein
VPIGVFAALVASRLRGGRAVLVVAACAALPVLFEAGQQVFRGLERACDTTDLVDNLSGVLLGLALGVLLVGLRWAASRNAGRVAP